MSGKKKPSRKSAGKIAKGTEREGGPVVRCRDKVKKPVRQNGRERRTKSWDLQKQGVGGFVKGKKIRWGRSDDALENQNAASTQKEKKWGVTQKPVKVRKRPPTFVRGQRIKRLARAVGPSQGKKEKKKKRKDSPKIPPC